MTTVTEFMNPTAIQKMPGDNWVRFCIEAPEGAAAGFYMPADLDTKQQLPKPLKAIGDELKLMQGIETFHINIGGEQSDRIVIKFMPNILVDDGILRVIADFIGENLG